MCPYTNEACKWLLIERYSYMDMLSSAKYHHPKQSEIQRFGLQFLSNRDPRRWDLQVLLLSVHSRVICLVSASSNCRMDMSLPHAAKGHKPFLEYPCELFSSWTVQKTCGRASGESPSGCEHSTTCWQFSGELHHLNFCPNSRRLLIAQAKFLAHLLPVWQTDLARLEVLFFFVTV